MYCHFSHFYYSFLRENAMAMETRNGICKTNVAKRSKNCPLLKTSLEKPQFNVVARWINYNHCTLLVAGDRGGLRHGKPNKQGFILHLPRYCRSFLRIPISHLIYTFILYTFLMFIVYCLQFKFILCADIFSQLLRLKKIPKFEPIYVVCFVLQRHILTSWQFEFCNLIFCWMDKHLFRHQSSPSQVFLQILLWRSAQRFLHVLVARKGHSNRSILKGRIGR